VISRYIGRLLTNVAVKVGERAGLLLDHVDPNAPIVLEMPTELIAIVDIKFTPDPGGDVCLVSRHLAFGVDSVAAHTSRWVTDREKPSVPPHYHALQKISF
jgi:hypothetical protein